MTELEYVLSGFENRFSFLKDKRILLHGTREYAANIIDRFRKQFTFVGVMSFDTVEGHSFHGLPYYEGRMLDELIVDAVVLTERVKYAEAAYQALHEICRRRGIMLYNMYGIDEIAAHRRIENCRPQSLFAWKRTCINYDLVALEVMDTLLVREPSGEAPYLRPSMKVLIRWLLYWGVDVRFSLRKSCPEKLQTDALKMADLCPDLENRLIRRAGEDLSFRRLKEENPNKRLLYIGMGLINECLLPLCYGIDTYRFVVDPTHNRPFYLQNWYRPVGYSGDNRIPYDKEWQNRIKQTILECRLISFDIFGTLLVRRTLTPWDVFELVEQRLKAQGIQAPGFAKVRKETGESMPCATLFEIYEALRIKRNWSSQFTEELMNTELEVERQVIKPRSSVVELFHFALQNGKRVVLTSDMYLPADILSGILNESGITGYDRILISCDCRKEKQSGLFSELLRLHNNQDEVLHIGDDAEADIEPCRQLGIRTFLLPSPFALATAGNWESAAVAANTLMERCLAGLCISELFQDPFQNPNLQERNPEERLQHFAYSVIGPLAISFLTWLIKKLHETACRGVLFMSRDGYLLWRIYRNLRRKIMLPEPYYYYVSRHSAFLCCADNVANIPWIVSLGNYTGINAQQKLTRIYELPVEKILQRADNEPEVDYISRHMPEINKIAEEERNAVMTYAGRIGLERNATYVIVDSMAAGTAQWFMENWMPFHFQGYYLGNCSPGLRKSENIQDYLEFQNDSLLKNYIEIESFFTSPEPSVRRFSQEGEVVFLEEKRSANDLDELRLVHNMAMDLASTFFSCFYTENEVINPGLPEEMFAADGCHWVQHQAYDDWTGKLIPTKKWEEGARDSLDSEDHGDQ